MHTGVVQAQKNKIIIIIGSTVIPIIEHYGPKEYYMLFVVCSSLSLLFFFCFLLFCSILFWMFFVTTFFSTFVLLLYESLFRHSLFNSLSSFFFSACLVVIEKEFPNPKDACTDG